MPPIPKSPLPKGPDWKHLLEVGTQFAEPRRAQVRRFVNDLVAQGQLARDQASNTVDEIVAMGQARAEELRSVIQTEVQRQVRALGLATQDDLRALERRVGATKSGRAATRPAQAKKAGAKKAGAKKAGAKAGAKPAGAKKRASA